MGAGTAGRVFFGVLLGASFSGFVLLMSKVVARDVKEAVVVDRYHEKVHRDKCIELRTTFFADCAEENFDYTQCQVFWSHVRAQVLDAPPKFPWANEIDCSKENK